MKDKTKTKGRGRFRGSKVGRRNFKITNSFREIRKDAASSKMLGERKNHRE